MLIMSVYALRIKHHLPVWMSDSKINLPRSKMTFPDFVIIIQFEKKLNDATVDFITDIFRGQNKNNLCCGSDCMECRSKVLKCDKNLIFF